MIKRPKEVNKILKKLGDAGYDAYCAGHCVTASFLGENPLDWDIYANCSRDELEKIFEEGEKIGKRILRLDYTEEVKSDDINVPDYYEGVIADVISYEGSIEDELKKYTFTVEAIAEHSFKSPIDPYGGRDDIKKLILRPVEDITVSFEKRPIKILEAIKYVSLYNFDLTKNLSEAIVANAGLLERARRGDILEEILEILNGNYAGKAMRMLADLGLLRYIVGEVPSKLNRTTAEEYEIMADKIDKVKHVPYRRLNLFYYRFRKHYQEAVDYLPHEKRDRELLMEAKDGIKRIYFINNNKELKSCIHRHGWETFYYLDKVLKAEAILFDYNVSKIEGRDAILQNIIMNKEPIFVEDLVIDADDIIEAGITDDVEKAEFLLSLLPEVVHKKPENNTRKKLLENAKLFNRSKLSRTVRGVTWLR